MAVELATAYISLVPSMKGVQGNVAKALAPAETAGTAAGKKAGTRFGAGFSSNMKRAVGAAAGLAIFKAGSAAIKGSTDAFLDLGVATKQLQRLTGGTVAEVSGLRGALQLSGVDVTKVNGSMTIFSKNLGKAAADSKKSAAMTDLLGTSFKNADGSVKPLTEILPRLADKFATMPDGAQKTALATQLFGRAGAAMLPALGKGSKGLAEMADKAKSLGITLNDGSIEKMGEYKEATRTWDATLQGLKVKLGQALIPALTKWSTILSEKLGPGIKNVSKWIRENSGLVKLITISILAFGAALAVANVALFVSGSAMKIWSVATAAAGIVQKAFTASTYTDIAAKVASTAALVGWTVVLYAVTAAQLVANVASKAWAAGTWLLNAALSANPIGLVVIALVALAAGLVYAYKHSETFRNVVNAVFTGVKNVVGGVLRWLTAAITNTIDFVRNHWKLIVAIIAGPIGLVVLLVSKNLGRIKGFFTSSWNAVKSITSKAWSGIKAVVSAGVRAVIDPIRAIPGKLRALGGLFKAGGRHLIQAFIDGLSNIGGTAASFAKKIWNAVKGTINGGIDKLNGMLEFSIKVGPKRFGVNPPDIGHLYGGTKNWKGGWTTVGERGTELVNLNPGAQVIPHHQIGNLAKTKDSAAGSMGELGDLSEVVLQVEIGASDRTKATWYVDGKRIAGRIK